MTRLSSEQILNEAAGGALPTEGDTLIWTAQGWIYSTLADQGDVATYSVSNLTVDRSYDADTVAVAELADVVGTLIADLKSKKVIS